MEPTKMIKVYIAQRHNLDETLLSKAFQLVNNSSEADIVIAQSTLAQDFDGDFSKVVYVAVEPPLASYRQWCYSHFDHFPLVVTHNPNPHKPNQIPFTESDEPQYYPTYPNPSSVPTITRENTTIQNRGIFYAGMIGPYESEPDAHGGINLTILRRQLGEFIQKNLPGSKIMGIGWNGQQTKVNDWRVEKAKDISESNCDFVLAMENTILPNYLYEKIWDGFASDRVTLYLGDPRIEHHIPTNCFVDLRKWFNLESREFDFEGFKSYILNMTQEEYDTILSNARAFRETAIGRHDELKAKLTNRIINFIRRYINN
jgi:hypothetical protein